ncbi:MAG: PilZ domain-containing protein [Hyphomicrobium sp.]|uniref:PilZ domain-containing protein n=1 Tax=Hyphomicrobium sp. TaxID=82 RepID=UPI0039E4165F
MTIERSREQRKFGRRTVFKPATVVFDDGRRVEGTLLDFSDGGAKIKVPNPEALTGEFFIEIPADDLSIRSRFVRLERGVVGVEHIKPPRRLSWTKK